MEITGEYRIEAGRETVWRALNDPDVLQRCIPGCESLQQVGDNAFEAKVTASIGPVRASFNTSLTLEDLNPPEGYRLVGRTKAAAGFGSGSAIVRLAESGDATLLTYAADFKVGGKLAQVGSRLVLGATRKIADEFFGAFRGEVEADGEPAESPAQAAPETAASKTWMAVGAAFVVLLIWWFLLR